MPHTLKVFQSAWALRTAKSPSDEDFGGLRRKAERVAAAGYDGIDILAHPAHRRYFDAWMAAAADAGLQTSVMAAPTSTDDVAFALEGAKRFRGAVPFINLLPKIPTANFDACVATLRHWLTLGREAGIPIYVETHRRTVTTDIWLTLRLLDEMPELGLVADLSHIVVSQEADLPLTATEQAWFPRILARAEAFQGRVATSQQIQVPIAFPQHQIWLELFKSWWREGFRSWRDRHASDADRALVFICELGPPFARYAITDGTGRELSDRWQEALVLKDAVRDLWKG